MKKTLRQNPIGENLKGKRLVIEGWHPENAPHLIQKRRNAPFRGLIFEIVEVSITKIRRCARGIKNVAYHLMLVCGEVLLPLRFELSHICSCCREKSSTVYVVRTPGGLSTLTVLEPA